MSLNVSATLAPTGGGSWPTHDEQYGLGGYRSVLDNAARDLIPAPRRVNGMLVNVTSTGNTYKLGAGLTNADWTLQSAGAITAGNGLTGTTALAVLPNGSTITVSAAGVSVTPILNAGIDPAAAIAGTKISPNFGSQNIVTTGFVSIGTNPAATGDIRFANNTSLTWRNAANSADLLGLFINNADGLVLGNVSSTTVINGPPGALNGIRMLINGSTVLNIGTTTSFVTSSVSFDGSQSSANFFQADQTGASTNGKRFTLHAQNATGATSTGGALDIAPGSGTTAGGLARLLSGSAVAQVQWNDTGVGFLGTAPVAKPTVSGAKGGNAALTSLLAALVSLGLITDTTT